MIPSDITITPLSGSGDSSVSMTMEEYTGRVAKPTREVWVYDTEDTVSDMVEVDQYPKTEFIGLNDPLTFSVAILGGEITVTGTSNSSALKPVEFDEALEFELSINGEVQSSWSPDNPTITGDIGADEEYSFSLKVTVPENQSTSQKLWTFQLSNNAQIVTATITINQAAGVRTYSDITILEFSYPVASAAGGILTPTLSYSQTWGWNESNTNGGTISGTLADPAPGTTFAFKGAVVDATTGVVTAASKGTTVSDITEVDAVTVTVTLNGQTSASSASVSVKQAANTASYGDIDFVGVPSANDIPASGGMSSVGNVKWSVRPAATQTISYTSGSVVTGTDNDGIPGVKPASIEIKSDRPYIVAYSKGTEVSARTEVDVFEFTATGAGGKTATKSLTIYQEANFATYGEVTIGQATPVSLAAPGETYAIVPAMKQTVTYTSGATRTEATPEDNKVQLSAEYAVKTAKEGFSLETNTGKVTVNLNPTTAPREGFVVTISAEGEGGKTATKDITFNQQGSESYITVSPETLTFEAAGGTQTITVNSNSSWTIS